jgi:hypothetical protein
VSDSEAILAASAAIRTPRAWGAVALVAVCATILPLGGCRKNNNICKLEPVRSTPGSLILVPSVNDESAAPELRSCIRLTIVDEHGQTVTAMETGVPAKTRWQIGIHADQRAYITSDARGVQCWEKQDDGRWQATRGCYKKVGPDRVRHGRWIWYHDDGTVDRVAWFYLGREVTEDEYVDLLIQEQKSRQGHVAQP